MQGDLATLTVDVQTSLKFISGPGHAGAGRAAPKPLYARAGVVRELTTGRQPDISAILSTSQAVDGSLAGIMLAHGDYYSLCTS